MTAVILFFFAALLLVGIAGLLSAIDASLGVVSRIELVDIAAHRRRPSHLHAVAADVGAHVTALNFVRIVAETLAAVLVTIGFTVLFDAWWWVLAVSAVIMIAASFIVVGSSPRSVGRAHPRAILATFDWLIRGVRIITGPIADALVALGNRVTPGRPASASFSSEEQLLSMVDEATELEVLDVDDRELIHSIFEFNDTIVREVMVPRTDMVILAEGATVAEAMTLFLSRGISRVPIVGDSADEVVGVIYLRDASRFTFEKPTRAATALVRELVKPAQFLPESTKADDALRQLQVESNHLALVVDEYGGIAGLVTMEDLIEELIGDINDEHDSETANSEQLSDGRFRVSARMPVHDLGDLFGIELDDDDVDTVGGLLTKHLGRLPVVGSDVTISGLHLTAERTEGRRKRVVTVLVQVDQALQDARVAFVGDRNESK